jgi:hypothetical protein
VNREAFEHVIKAAADIVNDEIVVVGSQSVLGNFPNAPPSLLRSQEVDLYPRSELRDRMKWSDLWWPRVHFK